VNIAPKANNDHFQFEIFYFISSSVSISKPASYANNNKRLLVHSTFLHSLWSIIFVQWVFMGKFINAIYGSGRKKSGRARKRIKRIIIILFFSSLTGKRFEPSEIENAYKVVMRLTINSVSQNDFGSYRCVSKNSLGDTDGVIKLYREYKLYPTH
jgi:hypothetical protein